MGFSPTFPDALHHAQTALAAFDLEFIRQAGLLRNPFDYYLLATYPPLKAMAPIGPDEVFVGHTGPHRAYVHIPFCEQYCTFCHYAKEIKPHTSSVTRYLQALHREIELTAERFGGRIRVESVYFGGGTPSYLTAPQLESLFAQFFRFVEPQGDLVFELHPGVVRQPDYEDRLRVLQSAGVNRWVFGIQSMDERVLAKLNRGHGRSEVYTLLDILRRRGCEDVSVDLIFGCPFQTLENWHETIRLLIEAEVDKFNVFPLMFKRADPIALHYERDPTLFPDESQRLLMHLMAEYVFQQNGFRLGPISYYSRGKNAYPGLDSIEACKSSEALGLVPLGVSAFGYVGRTQYYNHCDMNAYLQSLEQQQLPVWMGAKLSVEEQMRRAVMLGLRSRGIRISEFVGRFSCDPRVQFADTFARLEAVGLLTVNGDLMRASDLGALDAAGVASLFCSDEVRERVRTTNRELADRRTNLLERHDFSPIEHIGVRSGAQRTPPG